jgi:hypothetical protein
MSTIKYSWQSCRAPGTKLTGILVLVGLVDKFHQTMQSLHQADCVLENVDEATVNMSKGFGSH